jgi:AbrB family looped-hinge helix DNA binding protein
MERRHRAKITSKGQVTIPVEVRKGLGLNTGDVLVIRESAAGYIIEKSTEESKFDAFVGCLGTRQGGTEAVMHELRGDDADD